MPDLPIPVAPESELGRLLGALEAAEAEANAQRLVVTSARDAYAAAELAQRRSAYALSQSYRTAEELDVEHVKVLELWSTCDLEDRRLVPMLERARDLRQRFGVDYNAFLKLRQQFDELQRLAG